MIRMPCAPHAAALPNSWCFASCMLARMCHTLGHALLSSGALISWLWCLDKLASFKTYHLTLNLQSPPMALHGEGHPAIPYLGERGVSADLSLVGPDTVKTHKKSDSGLDSLFGDFGR